MSTLQGLRQASARAISGTELTIDGDMRALFETEATIPDGTDYSGAFLIWLNTRLSASHADLPTAMAEFAAAQGVDGWDDVGEFDAVAGQDGAFSTSFSSAFDGGFV